MKRKRKRRKRKKKAKKVGGRLNASARPGQGLVSETNAGVLFPLLVFTGVFVFGAPLGGRREREREKERKRKNSDVTVLPTKKEREAFPSNRITFHSSFDFKEREREIVFLLPPPSTPAVW